MRPKSPDKRIRVLFVVTSMAGGGGLHAYYLARHLPRDKFELTLAFGPGYPLDKKIAELNVNVEHLPLSRRVSPLSNLMAFFCICRLVRKHSPDILLTACSVAGILGRVAGHLQRVPVNAFVIHAYASRQNQPSWKRHILRSVESALDHITTHYIAVSQSTRASGVSAKIMRPEKVEVILNGIPEQTTPPDTRAILRKRWDIADGTPLIGTVARLEPQKAVDDFLRAAVQVYREHPEVRFVIVGEGPELNSLKRLAQALDISHVVTFAGWHDDVPAVMAALDVFCLSSLWEQFPFSVLEAMEASRPVVATSVDGVPEAVIEGQTGYLVPAAQPRALAAALTLCIKNALEAAEMGARGQARVRKEFSVERMIRRYEECLTRWSCVDAVPEVVPSFFSEGSNV